MLRVSMQENNIEQSRAKARNVFRKKNAHKVGVFVCPERGKKPPCKGGFPLLDTNRRYYHQKKW
jgi:hypothetical protein